MKRGREPKFSALLEVPHPPIPLDWRADRQEVVAALDATVPGDWVATDCDGTLWAGDVGDELVRVTCHDASADVSALTWDDYAALMERDYVAGCLASAACARGIAAEALRQRLAQGLERRIAPRRWLVDALERAMTRGVRVAAVSASARLAVEVGLAHVGLQPHLVIAVDPTPGGFAEPIPIGHGKVSALTAAGVDAPAVALGDSRWDGPMLDFARCGVLLAPAAWRTAADAE